MLKCECCQEGELQSRLAGVLLVGHECYIIATSRVGYCQSFLSNKVCIGIVFISMLDNFARLLERKLHSSVHKDKIDYLN